MSRHFFPMWGFEDQPLELPADPPMPPEVYVTDEDDMCLLDHRGRPIPRPERPIGYRRPEP